MALSSHCHRSRVQFQISMLSVYYEEVERYCPSPSFHRPLVLVGPALLHLDRLTDQIYDSDSDVFAQPILCEFVTKNMFFLFK